MIKDDKKIGWGSLSLVLLIVGILFSYSFGGRDAFGDSVLRFIGLNAWSSGNTGLHYTIFYSLIFYITAFILGYKFKNDFGATVGKYLSMIMIIFVVLLFLFFVQV